ncbi:MAG: hypothetical protein M3511_14125 [Deinococcota bacterium]|nr:hypothetical protein [Deinococcota bacterium]
MSNALSVSNSSPLIALEQIGQLQLLQQLFGKITVPPAVTREVAPTMALPTWVNERQLMQAIGPKILAASLGPGESEALSLALEVKRIVSFWTSVLRGGLLRHFICPSSEHWACC